MSTEVAGLLSDMLPRLRRFAIGLTGSAGDADDLVQATCERALRYAGRFQSGTRLDSWLFRIARNLYLNDLRSKAVRVRHLRSVEADAGAFVDGSREIESRVLLASIRRLVGRLSEEQRTALLLVAVEGLSYAETAAVLDLPIGTVTSRVARARIALKSFLDGAGDGAAATTESVSGQLGP